MFYYTYVLKSIKDKELYIGWTPDIRNRFKEHNSGYVTSTRSRRPFKLIFYEAFLNKKDAVLREKFFKTGWGRRHLKLALSNTLAGKGFE